MGRYRGEYEIYYQSILGKKHMNYKDNKNSEDNSGKTEEKDGTLYTKDIDKKNRDNLHLKDVMRCFVNINLFNFATCIVIASLLYVSKSYPSGQVVYKYIKDVSKVNLYYKNIMKEDSKLVFNISNSTKNKINSDDTLKENSTDIKPFDNFEVVKKSSTEILKNNSALPLNGMISFGEIKGIKEKYILVNSNDNKVKNVYKGIVKEIGVDEQLGEFIVIKSIDEVDIKYSNINSIIKKVGDEVTTGEIIAEIANSDNTKIKGVILQIIDGGEYKEPKDYINVK